MSSGTRAQDGLQKTGDPGEPERRVYEQEKASVAGIREQPKEDNSEDKSNGKIERDFEGGFGGLEDLEDRYATTSGEH